MPSFSSYLRKKKTTPAIVEAHSNLELPPQQKSSRKLDVEGYRFLLTGYMFLHFLNLLDQSHFHKVEALISAFQLILLILPCLFTRLRFIKCLRGGGGGGGGCDSLKSGTLKFPTSFRKLALRLIHFKQGVIKFSCTSVCVCAFLVLWKRPSFLFSLPIPF